MSTNTPGLDPVAVISSVCDLLSDGRLTDAADTMQRTLPFSPVVQSARSCSPVAAHKVFLRDGFIDRYSGRRLVFGGALRLLSHYMPERFPFQSSWRMSDTHLCYWQLMPTVDHLMPVARGGADEESNWVTTSQLHNSAKGGYLLSELGWSLHPPGKLSSWDGMVAWFVRQVEMDAEAFRNRTIRRWLALAKDTSFDEAPAEPTDSVVGLTSAHIRPSAPVTTSFLNR